MADYSSLGDLITGNFQFNLSDLYNQVQNSAAIDDVSRQELLKQLTGFQGTEQDLAKVSQAVSDALSGTGALYESRRSFQLLSKKKSDMPGRAQTVLTQGAYDPTISSNSAASLLTKGRG